MKRQFEIWSIVQHRYIVPAKVLAESVLIANPYVPTRIFSRSCLLNQLARHIVTPYYPNGTIMQFLRGEAGTHKTPDVTKLVSEPQA
jgi:hypothetical protein